MRRAAMLVTVMNNAPVPYLLRDDFTDAHAAGALHLTTATDGQSVRQVNDPDSRMSTTAGGLLNVAGAAASNEDYRPGLSYAPFLRSGYGQGMVMLAKVTVSAVRGPDYLGWYLTKELTHAGPWGNEYSIRLVDGAGIYAGIITGNSDKLGDVVAGTTYTVAVIVKAVGGECWIKGGAWATWTQLHVDTTTNNASFLFPTVSYYSDAPLDTNIDWVMVCPFQGYAFDRYLNASPRPRVNHTVLVFGDSKAVNAYAAFPNALSDMSHQFVMPTIASAGATVASRASTVAADIAAIVPTPEAVLWNLGASDVTALPAEATWKANAQTCIDAIVAKWASTKIYFMRVWVRNEAADCNTLATWYADLVAANPTTCFLGPDERVFLENGDDGATYTSDGIHPTVPAGCQLTADQWRTVLGY